MKVQAIWLLTKYVSVTQSLKSKLLGWDQVETELIISPQNSIVTDLSTILIDEKFSIKRLFSEQKITLPEHYRVSDW